MNSPLERVRQQMSLVDTSDPDACHEWPRACSDSGYGVIGRGRRGTGTVKVPRVVLEAKLGRALSPGMFALHTCDNPPCCNEAHIYEGTRADNARDAVLRGQIRTKLTDDQVRAIRAQAGRTATAVAAEFGVSRPLISNIWSGKSRRFVTDKAAS